MEIRDVCAAKKYKNRAGEEKTQWFKIGTAFIQDDGRISLDMAAAPIDGKCFLFPRKAKDAGTPF